MGISTHGKNVLIKNLTSSRFEPQIVLKQQPGRWNDHLKKQHLKFGQGVDACASNRFVYGSGEQENRYVNTEPRLNRYYTQPTSDTLPYGKGDYTNLHNNNSKLINMFSLEERSSAEIKKKAKEIKDVEEDRARYLKEKETNEMARMKEKKKDLELLQNYKEPWGKPGAGAPKSNNARTNAVQKLSQSPEQSLPLGKPGAGAPMRTDSGKLKTKTDVDPEIRFQKRERGQVVDVVCPDPKYPRENPFVTNLDILAKQTREQRKVIKRDENIMTDTNYAFYDPFGKPGGGAPTKDQNGNVVATRTFNLVRTVQETDPMQENAKFRNRPKWDAYLKKQHLKMDGERYVDKTRQQRYNEELEEIQRSQVERKQQDVIRERRESLKHADTWNGLWGKPGNGAPLSPSNRRRKVEIHNHHADQLLA